MYDVLAVFIAINISFLSIFVYEDIKSRSVSNIIVYLNVMFLSGLIVYSTLFLNALLISLFLVFGLGLFLFSKKTGNIGEGDVPILLSTVLLILMLNKFSIFIYFLEIFIATSLTIPFLIYKKTFTKKGKITQAILFSTILILILFNKFELSVLILLISWIYVIFSLYSKIDSLYAESVKYLEKEEIIPGDLIINSLLSDLQRKDIKVEGRLTFVDKKLWSTLNESEKYPIYYNSFPMTVPIFIAFIISIFLVI